RFTPARDHVAFGNETSLGSREVGRHLPPKTKPIAAWKVALERRERQRQPGAVLSGLRGDQRVRLLEDRGERGEGAVGGTSPDVERLRGHSLQRRRDLRS